MELKNNLKKVRMATLGVMAFAASSAFAVTKEQAIAMIRAGGITSITAEGNVTYAAETSAFNDQEATTQLGKDLGLDLKALAAKTVSPKSVLEFSKEYKGDDKMDTEQVNKILDKSSDDTKKEAVKKLTAKDWFAPTTQVTLIEAGIGAAIMAALGGVAMYTGFIGGGQ